jgi:MscS family membrane protein
MFGRFYIQIPIVIAFSFIFIKVITIVLYKSLRYFRKRNGIFFTSLIIELRKPLKILIFYYAISICVFILVTNFAPQYEIIIKKINIIAFYIIILTVILKTVTKVKTKYLIRAEQSGKNIDIAGVDMIIKIIKITIVTIWFLSLLNQIGTNLSALLAFSGVGGIAFGFAGKDLFANIFGGIILYLDKPFSVGDYISSPDREISGVIEYISWRQTKIISTNNIPLYIPNSVFSTIVIKNRNRTKFFKLDESINIKYNDFDKFISIQDNIIAMLKKHNGINKKNLPSIIVDSINKNITIKIVAITNTNNYPKFLSIKQDILTKLFLIVKESEIEIIFADTFLKIDKS